MKKFKFTIGFLFGSILALILKMDIDNNDRFNLIDANYNLLAYKNVLEEKNKTIEDYRKSETHNLKQFKKLKDFAINKSIQLKKCAEHVATKENQLTRCI